MGHHLVERLENQWLGHTMGGPKGRRGILRPRDVVGSPQPAVDPGSPGDGPWI